MNTPEGQAWVDRQYCAERHHVAATRAARGDDLLGALIALREWVRHPGEDDSPANEAVIDRADAAIAKATNGDVQPDELVRAMHAVAQAIG